MYLTPEEQAAGVRLKRRRRCGQCGPCQVKENCNKCHYCVRKDVLKQTCVYRKCVYLRSKPKPYMRSPRDVVPLSSRPLVPTPPQNVLPQTFISSPQPPVATDPPSVNDDPSVIKTPPVSSQDAPSQNLFSESLPVTKCSTESNGATVTQANSPAVPHSFPFSIPQPQRPFPVDNVLSQNAHFPGNSTLGGSGTIAPVPLAPRFDHTGPFTNNHSLVPGLASSVEKSFTEYNNQRFPHSHLHMPFPHHIRDSQSMLNMHYPTYGKSLGDSRQSTKSPSCMYGPSLPAFPSAMSAMSSVSFDRGPMPAGPLDPLDRTHNGSTSYPLNNSDLFRQYPSLSSATSGYPGFPAPHSYPHSGYSASSTYSGYSGFGMPHPPNIPIPPAIPGNSSHFGTYSASSALSSLNQTHGCPKNVQHPPASPTWDTPLMQGTYGCIPHSRGSVPSSDDSSQETSSLVAMETSETKESEVQQEGDISNVRQISYAKQATQIDLPLEKDFMKDSCGSFSISHILGSGRVFQKSCRNSSDDRSVDESHKLQNISVHSQSPYVNFISNGAINDSHIMSNKAACGEKPQSNTYNELIAKIPQLSPLQPTMLSPWSIFNVFPDGMRPASVFSSEYASHDVSSDFESDIICVDDIMMSAMIRSDGCNSIEIETEDKMSETLQRKSCCQGADVCLKSDRGSGSKMSEGEGKKSADCTSDDRLKMFIQGKVMLRQDLGEEGIVQLEIPGGKVMLEESVLDDKMAALSSNVSELIEFINKKPNIECGV